MAIVAEPSPLTAVGEAAEAWHTTRSFARDAVHFGTAVAASTLLGIAQVFLLPRLLSVATYGAYRVFIVYLAYVGVFHLGIADAALLRWAAQPLDIIQREWRRVFRWVMLLHVAVLLAAAVAAVIVRSPLARSIIVALAVTAVFTNLATVSTYALQAAGDFRWAGAVFLLPTAIFLGAVIASPPSMRSLAWVLVWYAASQGGAAVLAMWRLLRHRAEPSSVGGGSRVTFGGLLQLGWPVLTGNWAAAVAQSLDRVLVSIWTPVTTFALYGFATSPLAIATAATQALCKVALPHAAQRSTEDRFRFFGRLYDVITAGFGAEIVFYPLFELIVHRFLPAYVSSLPIVRALMVSAVFWVALNVVVCTALLSHQAVRLQLVIQVLGAVFVAATVGAVLVSSRNLVLVGTATAVAAAITWAVSVLLSTRLVSRAAATGAIVFAARTTLQTGAMVAGLMLAHNVWSQMGLTFVLAAFPTTRAALRLRTRE